MCIRLYSGTVRSALWIFDCGCGERKCGYTVRKNDVVVCLGGVRVAIRRCVTMRFAKYGIRFRRCVAILCDEIRFSCVRAIVLHPKMPLFSGVSRQTKFPHINISTPKFDVVKTANRKICCKTVYKYTVCVKLTLRRSAVRRICEAFRFTRLFAYRLQRGTV